MKLLWIFVFYFGYFVTDTYEDNPFNQAYNKIYLDPIDKLVRIGNTIHTNVTGQRSTDVLDSCHLELPNGKILELRKGFNGAGVVVEDTESICLISVGPIVEEMLGKWKLVGKFNGNGLFHEKIQVFNVILEDPKNPIEDPFRTITYLNHEVIKTNINGQKELIMSHDSFTEVHSCHIRTPDGLQYTFMQNFDVKGVKIIESGNNRVSCGVEVSVLSEDQIGNWTLIAREKTTSGEIERRLPFTVYVEEWVPSSPDKEAVVAKQNDFFIRLKNPTDLYDTCELIAPNGEERPKELDTRFVDRCGFIVRNVAASDNGVWEIRFGTKITYRSQVTLLVQDLPVPVNRTLTLTRERPVNITFGPDRAVYCKIEDPSGVIVFNDFSTCRLELDNVLARHAGLWKSHISLPGHMVSIEEELRVVVSDYEPTKVNTSVIMDPLAAVLLSCSVSSASEFNACKFRDPSGRIILASHGLGEDRYTFHGTGVSFHSDKYHMECGIKISNPTMEDMGIWRCAIDSTHDTYFGFLTVLSPSFMEDPGVADKILTEPVLTSQDLIVDEMEGDSAQMLCRISATIRYCYFRSPNGTVISVYPDLKTENLEFLGQGFSAGECGLKIRRINDDDRGTWTCNVGIDDLTASEQNFEILIRVQPVFMYRQYFLGNSSMVVGGITHRPLEHCRFVRSDGLGFSGFNTPPGYVSYSHLGRGTCGMTVVSPTSYDKASWTIAVRRVGDSHEHTVTTFLAEDLECENTTDYGIIALYVILGLLCLIVVCLLMIICLNRKNRRNALERVKIIRNSFTKSSAEKPIENISAVVDMPVTKDHSPGSA